MSASPDLEFRRLTDEELPLAAALADSVGAADDPRREAWGLTAIPPPAQGGGAWGVFVRGSLAGAAWVDASAADVLEIAALALPRSRWGLGLAAWMAREIAREVPDGCREILIRLDGGPPSLGEELEDAGFAGPGVDEEGYPKGEWRRLLSIVAANDGE